jgi:hypothetical protein
MGVPQRPPVPATCRNVSAVAAQRVPAGAAPTVWNPCSAVQGVSIRHERPWRTPTGCPCLGRHTHRSCSATTSPRLAGPLAGDSTSPPCAGWRAACCAACRRSTQRALCIGAPARGGPLSRLSGPPQGQQRCRLRCMYERTAVRGGIRPADKGGLGKPLFMCFVPCRDVKPANFAVGPPFADALTGELRLCIDTHACHLSHAHDADAETVTALQRSREAGRAGCSFAAVLQAAHLGGLLVPPNASGLRPCAFEVVGVAGCRRVEVHRLWARKALPG